MNMRGQNVTATDEKGEEREIQRRQRRIEKKKEWKIESRQRQRGRHIGKVR